MHQSGLRVLKGLLNCSMSLVFTFVYVTNYAKALTLEGTFDFHKKLAWWKVTKFETLDKAGKKDFLLRKFMKRMVPKLSYLELKESMKKGK